MLTSRQRRFVEEYSISHCAASAARKAGYSPKGAKVIGCNLLTNINLQAALAEKQAEAAQKLQIDRDTVVREIRDAIATARMRADAGNMIRGSIELAKLFGFYNASEVKSFALSPENVAQQARFNAMSDVELIAIAEGRAVAA